MDNNVISSRKWHTFTYAQASATTTSSGTGTTTTTTTRYVLGDHLGGTNVITDSSGNIAETLDYYPYGAARIDTKVGSYGGEKHKYVGTEYDSGNGLNYMQARYQDPQRGQFLSEDPMFLGDPSNQDLVNPQNLNSYNYAGDNPIVKSDPNGKFAPALGIPLLFPEVSVPVLLLAGAAFAGIVAGQYLYRQNWFGGYDDASLYQASKMVSGQGYDTEPKPPIKTPKGPLGPIAVTAVSVGLGALAAKEFFQLLQEENEATRPALVLGQNISFPGGPGNFGTAAQTNQAVRAPATSINTTLPYYAQPTAGFSGLPESWPGLFEQGSRFDKWNIRLG